MARQSKKNVYILIENKKNEIEKANEYLEKLNDEMKVLLAEKDDLEMRQLLEQMKLNNLDIDKALALLGNK